MTYIPQNQPGPEEYHSCKICGKQINGDEDKCFCCMDLETAITKNPNRARKILRGHEMLRFDTSHNSLESCDLLIQEIQDQCEDIGRALPTLLLNYLRGNALLNYALGFTDAEVRKELTGAVQAILDVPGGDDG